MAGQNFGLGLMVKKFAVGVILSSADFYEKGLDIYVWVCLYDSSTVVLRRLQDDKRHCTGEEECIHSSYDG